MKVLVVPSWYTNEFNRVKGSFFKEQAEAIAKSGVEVIVLAISTLGIKEIIKHPFKSKLFKVEESIINNVKTFSINVCSFGLERINKYDLLYEALFKKYYNIIKGKIGKVDVIHAHSFRYAGYSSCKFTNDVPIVITEHISAIINNELSNKDLEKLKFSLKHANKFVCVSNHLKKNLIKITSTNKDIIVIPNIVSDIFHYNCTTNNNKNRFVFCSASNLVKGKRVDILIRAFFKAFEGNDNVMLKIAGDGVEKSNLQELINKLNLNNKVLLLGQLDRKELLKLYQDSDAFIMVSAYETFGLVYAESLMCGLPTIGTLNGGANDILDCYGGYLCEVDNINDIAKNLLIVYNNYNSIDRNRIHNEALSRFSRDIIATRIINVYEDILTTKFK